MLTQKPKRQGLEMQIQRKSVEISRRLQNVPKNVRGWFADTLADLFLLADEAGYNADALVDERIDKINRGFATKEKQTATDAGDRVVTEQRQKVSTFVKDLISELADEAIELKNAAARASGNVLRWRESERVKNPKDDDASQLAREQARPGITQMKRMSHRDGGSGYMPDRPKARP